MSEVEYWKARCRRAEGLLQKARSGVYQTRQRAAVLRKLGELKPDQWMDSVAIERCTGVSASVLREMQALGLVVSRPVPGRSLCEWQLEYLVVGPEAAPEGGAA
jgi:hypothetical protein